MENNIQEDVPKTEQEKEFEGMEQSANEVQSFSSNMKALSDANQKIDQAISGPSNNDDAESIMKNAQSSQTSLEAARSEKDDALDNGVKATGTASLVQSAADQNAKAEADAVVGPFTQYELEEPEVPMEQGGALEDSMIANRDDTCLQRSDPDQSDGLSMGSDDD